MPDTLLVFFRICVLALLYLFFFRVLRAVWTEISTSPTTATATRRRERRPRDRRPRSEAHLKVVEPQEMAGATFSLADELTIGRAVGCQITLDDTYVSQLHARVFRRGDGQLYVEDLGSTNGTYLNRGKVRGPMIIKRGDRLQVGQVVMELR